jgi:sugar phosphate isomerase/epimerase
MKTSQALNRREFLCTGLAGAATLTAAGALTAIPATAIAAVTKPEADPFRGLKVGIASYSLRKFTLDQAITMTKQAGVQCLTLKDFHLPLKSTAEERREARRKVESAGLQLMGGGVIYIKNSEAEVRAAFDYARDAGMPVIVCSPDPAALDIVERCAKEYDIRIAIHNHGPGDDRYASPLDVMRLVKDRDSRMGICMDVGHTVRIKQDPIKVMKACASRLYDFHIKDVTAADAKGGCIEMGRGVIDLVGVIRTLVKLKFKGHVALEYEIHDTAPMPGIQESFGFMRGVLATI